MQSTEIMDFSSSATDCSKTRYASQRYSLSDTIVFDLMQTLYAADKLCFHSVSDLCMESKKQLDGE